MKKSEAIRAIECFGNLIGFHYIQAQQIAAEIVRQRNRIVTLSPKTNRKRQRHLRKRPLSKYRNCIVIEPITLKLNVELYETLVECVKESRKVVNIPDLIDYILDNEDTESANELRIIERRWNYALQGIDNILCFDNVPEKMKYILFDYKSEMQSFGHDLHLIDRVCTITKEEATRKMHGQDWEEMREAETKYTSDEFFRFELDKLNKLINEQIQSDSITVSNETPTKKQNGKCDTLTSTKFKVTNKVGFDMVSQLYEFVNKDGWFDTNELSREDFIVLTGKADFRRFYDAEKKLRTKVRFIICQLSKRSIYPKEWFAQACKLLELDAKQMGKHDGITQQWLRRWERTFPEPKDGYFEG